MYDVLTSFTRASRLFKRGFNGVFVIMDTMSELDVLEPKKAFPSDRCISMGTKTFVYYDLPTRYLISAGIKTLGDSVDLRKLSKFGPPIWNAFCSSKTTPLEELLLFARRKLLCSPRGDMESVENPLVAAAFICCRTTLDPNPFARLSTWLLSSHMASLKHFNHANFETCVGYPTDPILARAASEAMIGSTGLSRKTPTIFARMISQVSDLIRHKEVASGERGELVCQLIFLHVMDKLTSGPNQSKYTTVRGFLGTLLDLPYGTSAMSNVLTEDEGLQSRSRKRSYGHEQYRDKVSHKYERYRDMSELVAKHATRKNEGILDGVINATHFIQIVEYTPNRADLVEYFKRNLAVVTKRNQPGFDIVIPVLLPVSYRQKEAHNINNHEFPMKQSGGIKMRSPMSADIRSRLTFDAGRFPPELHASNMSPLQALDWLVKQNSMQNGSPEGEFVSTVRGCLQNIQSLLSGLEKSEAFEDDPVAAPCSDSEEDGIGPLEPRCSTANDADSWPTTADRMSYILIDSKCYMADEGANAPSLTIRKFPYIEGQSDDTRPYLALGFHFTSADEFGVSQCKWGEIKKRMGALQT